MTTSAKRIKSNKQSKKISSDSANIQSKIKVVSLVTVEKSIWSDQQVRIYFKDVEKAKSFNKLLNSQKDIHIDFEIDEDTYITPTDPIKSELEKSDNELLNYLYDWAVSWTREHKPGYKPQFVVKECKEKEKYKNI